jgi:GINS complex subunit 4
MDWDEEYDLLSRTGAGPSFIDRARNASPDDDFNVPIVPAVAPPYFQQPTPDETPLEQLIRHWMNERHAPDILPAQDVLLSTLLDHIRRQVSIGLSNRIFWRMRSIGTS